MLRTVALIAASAVAVALLTPGPSASADAPNCPDYHFITARGTDAGQSEADGLGPVNKETYDTAKTLLAGRASVDAEGLIYPASGYGSPWRKDKKKDQLYFDSVTTGANALKTRVAAVMDDCPATQFVLLGYSQGADVMRRGAEIMTASQRARVAGTVVFGSPVFNNYESNADRSTYDPSRTGLIKRRAQWTEDLDSPVLSVCHRWDLWCQGAHDLVIAGHVKTVRDPISVIQHTGSNWFKYHETYVSDKDTDRGACELIHKLGFSASCTDFRAKSQVQRGSYLTTAGLDVVFLVDTTSSGALEELQGRAEDFVSQASHRAAGTRYAVIDYGQGFANNATGGFISDPAEAVAAIQGLSVSGGSYGAVYSAIDLANELNWRDSARKVSLVLSTSRACAQQECTYEAYTGTHFNYLSPGSDARRAGVYTRDNDYFFDAPGWAQAVDDRWRSRPGSYQPASVYVDELARVFGEALRYDGDDHIAGTSDTTVGQSGYFAAADVVPFYDDSPSQRLVWNVQRTGDAPGRGDGSPGGGGPVESFSAFAAPRTEAGLESSPPADDTHADEDTNNDNGDPEPSPLPADQGPSFQTEFTQSGTYTVTLKAYHDGGVDTYNQVVVVNEVPTQAPAAPSVSSTIVDGVQTFTWQTPIGEQPTAYGLADSAGDVVDYFTPESVEDGLGRTHLETSVHLDDDGTPYSLVAYNEVGGTPAIGLVPVRTASYAHATLTAGQPSGSVLTLSGSGSPELSAALRGIAPGGSADVSSATAVSLITPYGEEIPLDLTHLSGTIHNDESWQAEFDLRDVTTMAGDSVADALRDGLADDILVGGGIKMVMDGPPMILGIDYSTTTSQANKWTIDTDSPPPAGISATAAVDRSAGTWAFTTTDPAITGLDWSAARLSAVRTWVGNAEIRTSLVGTGIDFVDDPTSGDTVTFRLEGAIAEGDTDVVREFLHDGTIAITVDGTPVVLAVSMTEEDAAAAYPATAPPLLLGDPQIASTQYGDSITWQPIVRSGTSTSVDVYLEGQLPTGLSWDIRSHTLSGVALDTGTFPITLTAYGDSGEDTRSYILTVQPSTASPAILIGSQGYSDNGDGTGYFEVYGTGWLRPDNPAFTDSLPALQLAPADSYFAALEIDGVVVHTADGNVAPVTGSWALYIGHNAQQGDWISLSSEHLTRTDGESGPISDLLQDGGTVTFHTVDGATNTLGFS